MTRLSVRSRLLCAAGALPLSTVPAAHPAFAQGHNDVILNLDNTFNPEDAKRREDELRRRDGRPEEGQHRRPDLRIPWI